MLDNDTVFMNAVASTLPDTMFLAYQQEPRTAPQEVIQGASYSLHYTGRVLRMHGNLLFKIHVRT